MTNLIEQIVQSLRQGHHLVAATIMSSSGSTPRTSGSKILVYSDGTIAGTIGGGAVEGDVMTIASHLFSTQGAQIVDYDLTQNNLSEGMDLICGGKMKVLVEYLAPDAPTVNLFTEALVHIQAGRPFILHTTAKTAEGGWQTSKGIELFTESSQPVKKQVCLEKTGEELHIYEPVLPGKTVYILGGGHVSKEIAYLTKRLGFRTLIFDDREEFANPTRFPAVDGTYICPGYADVFTPFAIDGNSYIVILTRGHNFDKEVLAQALKTSAGYIGMIGSKKKRASIYQRLLDDGFSRSDLERIFCPIGLPISAETTEEIGISVVAELIQHRANQLVHG